MLNQTTLTRITDGAEGKSAGITRQNCQDQSQDFKTSSYRLRAYSGVVVTTQPPRTTSVTMMLPRVALAP